MRARRLPITLPPAHNEATGSYIGRLIEANHLNHRDFWDFMADRPGHRSLTPTRLAQLSGYPASSLQHALPELQAQPVPTRFHRRALTACPGCTARHRGQVHWFLDHHHRICQRHKLWIGPPSYTHTDRKVDISALPELFSAQHQHRLLVRRHGPERSLDAFNDALHIQLRWAQRGEYGRPRDRRLDLLADQKQRFISLDEDLFRAAIYPETVALAGLLVSPYWRHRLATASPLDPQPTRQFEAEAGRRIGYPHYQRFYAVDPLGRWIDNLRDHT